MWKSGLAEYDDLEGIAWRWQSIDGATMKAPLAQECVGPNPRIRGKNGSKRHLLVDGHGVPLSLGVSGANRQDVSQLKAVTSWSSEPNHPSGATNIFAPTQRYTGAPALQVIEEHGYIPHVKGRGQEASER